jgi:hypothetical protein
MSRVDTLAVAMSMGGAVPAFISINAMETDGDAKRIQCFREEVTLAQVDGPIQYR